jgi:nitroreductase
MFNDRASTIGLLLSRRSGKARDMVAPGPSPAELETILRAAQRVPDHGKLAPWRFVVVPALQRTALADLIEAAYRAEKPSAGTTEIDAVRAYALQGETLLVVLSTPKVTSHIPLWEQQLTVGAACQNLMLAAHALGFVGNWLTGWPAYSDRVKTALGGGPDDRIAGFFYLGSPTKPLEERPRPDYAQVVSSWAPPTA